MTKYEVFFENFTVRHFMKYFAKKYKGAWDNTMRGMIVEFTFFDLLFEKSIAETIVHTRNIKICKTEFKIAGTTESRHTSGNRCIVAVHSGINKVCVLLVYGKTDLRGHNETVEWRELIKDNYPEYANIL